MIISSPEDYRIAAKARLPRFLFDYIDGGANSEITLGRNTADLRSVALRQRVLRGGEAVDLKAELFGQSMAMPLILSPVGLTGMYARRGEVQAARAAAANGIPFTLSTVSVCPLEEVQSAGVRPVWFQLYVLKDRAFMTSVMERALAAGITTLVFTVDMPVPGTRYRDAHSGMSGPNASIRRLAQALLHPGWAWSVGLRGQPHDLGNISVYRGRRTKLADYMDWLSANFDPSISWRDLSWIRDKWPGTLLIKGILDPDDVADAIALGTDGIIVSNHGGRQLDGAPSTVQALPGVIRAAKGQVRVLVDSGFRSGADVIRALCLGADAVMIGRSYIYALAAGGEKAVSNLLELYAREMATTMTLIGAARIADLDESMIAKLS